MAYINKCSHSRPVFLFTSIYHHKSDLGKTWNGLTYCWVVFILAKWRMWEQKQYNFKERTRESPEYTDKQPLCWQMVVMNSEALEFVISLSISKRNECHHKQLSTPSPISSGLSCMMFHWTTQHSYTNKVSECLVRGWLHNIQSKTLPSSSGLHLQPEGLCTNGYRSVLLANWTHACEVLVIFDISISSGVH